MITNPTLSPNLQLVSNHEFAEVWKNPASGQQSLLATVSFKPGDVICSFSGGTMNSEATYLTVQVGDNKHITLQPEFLQYINHSCKPSVFFDTTLMQLVCLTPLNEGDEMTFFYPSTEWDMVQPFTCYCSQEGCLGKIQGAYYITDEVLAKYKLTDYIRSKQQNRQQ